MSCLTFFESEFFCPSDGRLCSGGAFVEVHGQQVAGFQNIAQVIDALAGIKLAGGHGITEKDAGETFSHHNLAASRAQSNGRMFARTAAAEILPAHDDRILGLEPAFLDETGRIERFRQAAKRVAAELFVLVRNRRHESEILRRNDLIGVDVVSHHINRAAKNRLHRVNLAGQGRVGNQNVGAAGGGMEGWSNKGWRTGLYSITPTLHPSIPPTCVARLLSRY